MSAGWPAIYHLSSAHPHAQNRLTRALKRLAKCGPQPPCWAASQCVHMIGLLRVSENQKIETKPRAARCIITGACVAVCRYFKHAAPASPTSGLQRSLHIEKAGLPCCSSSAEHQHQRQSMVVRAYQLEKRACCCTWPILLDEEKHLLQSVAGPMACRASYARRA